MAVSRKIHVISTKYFMCINWGHYVIYLQKMKFVRLIPWPGGAYTDDTYATKFESRSHIRIHFIYHDYIGSFWECQMSQNHLESKCRSKRGSGRSSKSESKCDSSKRTNGARKKINVHAVYMKFMEVIIMIAQWRTWMNRSDLSFIHRNFWKKGNGSKDIEALKNDGQMSH